MDGAFEHPFLAQAAIDELNPKQGPSIAVNFGHVSIVP